MCADRIASRGTRIMSSASHSMLVKVGKVLALGKDRSLSLHEGLLLQWGDQ